MKIYEIPVYAMNPDVFKVKVEEAKEKERNKYIQTHDGCTDKDIRDYLYLVFQPFQLYDYNHIVGYIVISIEGDDVDFKVYLQTEGRMKKSRYVWYTSKKWFLDYHIYANPHFRVPANMDNDTIRGEIHKYLDEIIESICTKDYYVDRSAFDNIDSTVDYRNLLNRSE